MGMHVSVGVADAEHERARLQSARRSAPPPAPRDSADPSAREAGWPMPAPLEREPRTAPWAW